MAKNTKPFSDNNKQQLVLYGRHAVLAALKNPKRQILKILCTKENADEIRRTSKIQPQEVVFATVCLIFHWKKLLKCHKQKTNAMS